MQLIRRSFLLIFFWCTGRSQAHAHVSTFYKMSFSLVFHSHCVCALGLCACHVCMTHAHCACALCVQCVHALCMHMHCAHIMCTQRVHNVCTHTQRTSCALVLCTHHVHSMCTCLAHIVCMHHAHIMCACSHTHRVCVSCNWIASIHSIQLNWIKLQFNAIALISIE